MSAQALPSPLRRPPQSEGLGRGFAFALAAHLLLVLGLSAGLAWRTETPPAFEAELWASVPVAAAPREQEPPPPPPEESSEATPPKPTPQAEPEPDTQQQREAEIAIAKEREKKLKQQREEEAQERKRLADLEAKRREELKKKEEALKQAKLKEEQAKKDKAEKEKAEREKAEKDKLAKEKSEKSKADAATKKAEAQAEAKREALRQENLRRIQGMAGATGGPQATGTAQHSAGPSASYAGRIKARVRPNIIYTDSGAGNPLAEVEVRVGADGTILNWRLVKPSGNAEWDNAVLRAIEKTGTLPRDVDGRVPSLMVLAFQPRE